MNAEEAFKMWQAACKRALAVWEKSYQLSCILVQTRSTPVVSLKLRGFTVEASVWTPPGSLDPLVCVWTDLPSPLANCYGAPALLLLSEPKALQVILEAVETERAKAKEQWDPVLADALELAKPFLKEG